MSGSVSMELFDSRAQRTAPRWTKVSLHELVGLLLLLQNCRGSVGFLVRRGVSSREVCVLSSQRFPAPATANAGSKADGRAGVRTYIFLLRTRRVPMHHGLACRSATRSEGGVETHIRLTFFLCGSWDASADILTADCFWEEATCWW